MQIVLCGWMVVSDGVDECSSICANCVAIACCPVAIWKSQDRHLGSDAFPSRIGDVRDAPGRHRWCHPVQQ